MLVVVLLLLLVAAEAFDDRVGKSSPPRPRASPPPPTPLSPPSSSSGDGDCDGCSTASLLSTRKPVPRSRRRRLGLRRRRQQRLLQPEVDGREVVRVRLEHDRGLARRVAAVRRPSLALRQSLARAHDLQQAVHESATPHHRGRFAYAAQPSLSLSTHLGSSPAHALPSSSPPCGHRTVTSSQRAPARPLSLRSPSCGRERPSGRGEGGRRR